MTSKLTIEQAKRLRNDFECWQQDYDPKDDKEQYDMFGRGMTAMDMLIAGMHQEPVAYIAECGTIVSDADPFFDDYKNPMPVYRHAQPAPELAAIVERLNLSGYEYEGGEVTPQNAAAIVDTLLQQLDDAVQGRNAQPAPTIQVTDAMDYAFHHALTDGPLGDDDVEDIKTGLRAAFATVTIKQPAQVVQCPYPCGWDNLNKLAIQDAALVARGLVEGEPTTEAQRQAAISNNDRLLKVISACRAAMLQSGILTGEGTKQAEPVTTANKLPETQFKQVADLYAITSPTGSETTFTFDPVEAANFKGGGWSVQEYVELERLQEAMTGNSPAIPDGYVMVPKVPTESMINAWLSEVANWRGHVAGYKAMLAAAPQDTPALDSVQSVVTVSDTWIPVSERIPDDNSDVLCTAEFDGPGDWRRKVGYWHEGKWVVYGASWTPTHWMPLPAAPQEVKGDD
ncbi:DUF551 domain-containing protein [Klebsiella aerogenes]|uniref:DUF551 domain-containing protein n=1 Tax=Klebsiella aerogenes TaxID=548 RepID=UPI001CC09EB9|nr:DUF551 domain-containing protein [Klebsiella aerogenes]MBX9066991.1 DUF551 domain-containing protein [Klebsiella aerogenes]